MQLTGEVALNGEVAELDMLAEKEDGHVSKVVATLKHADLTPFALKRNDQGVIRQGLSAFVDLTVSATRARDGVPPALAATIDIDPGQIYADGDPQELSGGQINLVYDFSKQTVEIARSNARFGATTLPINGALIDLDKLDRQAKQRLRHRPARQRRHGSPRRLRRAAALLRHPGDGTLHGRLAANSSFPT